ncbi:hypothetical protein LR48_Vigan393s000700 [Vigna angularis]|uniref:NLE domain-containing protein n=1 Tax=Phaseolus angularis TaxID=3914 RepID=A0A0L9T912_PHAAN|nr:hypothetical protein LR48_Vigan393s000700 [Vigna angularis]
MVQVSHGIEGEESDEGVIGEVVVDEEEEVLLEGEQLVVGGGKIDEKDEGGGREGEYSTVLPLGHVTDLSIEVPLAGTARLGERREPVRPFPARPVLSKENVNFHRSALCTRLHQPDNSVSIVRPRILSRSVKTSAKFGIQHSTLRPQRLGRSSQVIRSSDIKRPAIRPPRSSADRSASSARPRQHNLSVSIVFPMGLMRTAIHQTETMVEKREIINNVMCLLTDPDGTPLGSPMYLPQNAGPQHLNQIVNKLQNNEEKLPYAFYISDEELIPPLETYLQKNKVSVEKALPIVCQPQAIFRIRPVNRCSATISGHKNWVLCIAWSLDGKYLVSGSKAGELICWDPQTGKSLGNPLTGHKKWITGIAWEPVHLNSPCRRFVSASKDGDARIWDVSLKKCVMCLSGHTLAITCVKWGGDGVIYTGSQDCTIIVWETTQGKLIRELKSRRNVRPAVIFLLDRTDCGSELGHGHWVNSLALSTEYVLRTGAFDHTGKQYVALERYQAMRGNAPERLVSGSDDFTMFLWEPFVNKHPKTRMTGHQQVQLFFIFLIIQIMGMRINQNYHQMQCNFGLYKRY